MNVLAAADWAAQAAAHPGRLALAAVGLAGATALAALALRAVGGRARSLRAQVLAVTLGSLALGSRGALVLAWLMVLDAGELATVVSVLAVTSVLASVLVAAATAPLGRDVRRLERTVAAIEAGDREARTGLERVDELGHVARAVDDLNRRLGQLERRREAVEAERTSVLSSIGHDLRTPLAALRAAVEALADGVVDDTGRWYRSMQHDVEALGVLIDDLFLLVRVEEGRLDLERGSFDLAEVADEAIEALAPTANARGVRLRLCTAGRVGVHGDPAALGRVIRNLLDNAIRHSPAGSEVVVAVEPDGEGAVMRVDDAGPGFPPTSPPTRSSGSPAPTRAGAGTAAGPAWGWPSPAG